MPTNTAATAVSADSATARLGDPCRTNRRLRPVTATQAALLRPPIRPLHPGSRPGPEPGLNFGLIHPRPGPFTGDHPDRVRAARGRWRTPVNTMQHCWKACWGQPLRSSNLLSSATLNCDDALGSSAHCATSNARVSFPVSVEPWPYFSFPTNRCGATLR